MPTRITVNDAATLIADHLLQGVAPERQAAILPATKYNVLVKAFNVSSICLLAAAVSAIFLAFSAACVFLAVGVLLRWATEKELGRYAIQPDASAGDAGSRDAGMMPSSVMRIVQTFLPTVFPEARREVASCIQRHVGIEPREGWEADEVVLFDYVVWKNSVDIPPENREGAIRREFRLDTQLD
ncbi:MAG: hypothetical protein KGQ49_01405 [Verrucomicrobia bacterium]|nr:hypothetical protein [Verrucomicrobiota bacterium]MBU6446038.1 hypothetical protein [Verrucomicrobiota bacterium]MDE3047615.1 hypothetical protein [Verrucomicrobiota bacterium]